MIDQLISTAEDYGLTVAWHKGAPKAAWIPEISTISLQHGLDDAETLCALAHELGHAYHGDPAGHDHIHEHRADVFAAKLLIVPEHYAQLESVYGAHPARLAIELGVTRHLVEVWQQISNSRTIAGQLASA